MKLRKTLLVLFPVIVLVLEALPYGAVCVFANAEGDSIRRTFSYFDLTPFGYANFGPFITAILTCVLLVLAVVVLFRTEKGCNTAILVVSIVATAVSLTPLLFGIKFFSIIGVIISILLAAEFCVSLIKPQNL